MRVRGLDGSALADTVLHESLHALDEMTVREPTAMAALWTRVPGPRREGPAIVEAWTRRIDRGEGLDATADAIAKAVTAP